LGFGAPGVLKSSDQEMVKPSMVGGFISMLLGGLCGGYFLVPASTQWFV
jgi:hypothetical protein